METKKKTNARCAFLTNGPDGNIPAKTYTNYDGPVPPETCEHFCSRFIDCAKNGMFFPVPVGDASGELWQKLEECAAKLPRLESASTATYLHRTVENLMRRYFTRVVAPLREEYRLVEQRLVESGDASATSRDLAESLPAHPCAAVRQDEATAFLAELIPLLPDEIARAFLAYIAADGNLLEAAHIARIGKSRFYSSWSGWLKTARRIAKRIN